MRAPTGSGKTLAYAIPIVNVRRYLLRHIEMNLSIKALMNRFISRVRALVIVPTRDLVSQVFKVFQWSAATTISLFLY